MFLVSLDIPGYSEAFMGYLISKFDEERIDQANRQIIFSVLGCAIQSYRSLIDSWESLTTDSSSLNQRSSGLNVFLELCVYYFYIASRVKPNIETDLLFTRTVRPFVMYFMLEAYRYMITDEENEKEEEKLKLIELSYDYDDQAYLIYDEYHSCNKWDGDKEDKDIICLDKGALINTISERLCRLEKRWDYSSIRSKLDDLTWPLIDRNDLIQKTDYFRSMFAEYDLNSLKVKFSNEFVLK
jgi:hypothetical protein